MFKWFTKKYQVGTNQARVFKYLSANKGKWVSMLDFWDVCKVKHHTDAIYRIRKLIWFECVEMKEERYRNKNWEMKKRTFYKLNI